MTERQTREIHEKRKMDSQQIYDSGDLVASAAAAISLIAKSAPPEACLAFKEKALDEFRKGTREYRIKSILHIEEFLHQNVEAFHPNVHDSDIAFQTRRLDIISRIVKADIAEGQMAVDTANLLLGVYHFSLENNELYKQWSEAAEFLSEWPTIPKNRTQ